MITVMFSSYNGGDRLRRTLESMTRARAPRGGWRLVVVDNRSTDGSYRVMSSFAGALPIEVLREAGPGKNRALNRALEVALADDASDLFVFCDDDVLVAEDWLEAWRGIADANPGFDVFAGLTAPAWPAEPPDWILRYVRMGVVFGVHEAVKEGSCDPRLVYGTNMAVRARAFRTGIRFNQEIGPNGSQSYPMGSETELVLRLVGLGHTCWFAPQAKVLHIIRPEQLEPAWILKRAYRFGHGSGSMGEPHAMAITRDRIALKNTLKGLIYPWLLPLLPWKQSWSRHWQWAYDRGYEDGIRAVSKPRLSVLIKPGSPSGGRPL